MMMKPLSLFAVLAIFPAVAASQVRDPGLILRGSARVLEQAGFAGMQGVADISAPDSVKASPVQAPVDETAEAIAAIAAVVQRINQGTYPGEVLRKVGIPFSGDDALVRNMKVADGDVSRFITIPAIPGSGDQMIMEAITKVGGRKLLRSYLISANGSLRGAAASRKENGVFVAEAIPLPEAESGYREQLDFWLRYYRANLKKP